MAIVAPFKTIGKYLEGGDNILNEVLNDTKPMFPIKPKPDWDKIAHGKTRSLVTAAFIEGYLANKGKWPEPSDENVGMILGWTHFCMTGKTMEAEIAEQGDEPFPDKLPEPVKEQENG